MLEDIESILGRFITTKKKTKTEKRSG